MNLFTKTKKVIKLDYFGKPYQATILEDKRIDKGELWKRFKEMQKETLITNGHDNINTVAINNYHERLLEP